MLYGSETWGVRAEGRRFNVSKMKCERGMAGVTLWDRVNNDTLLLTHSECCVVNGLLALKD